MTGKSRPTQADVDQRRQSVLNSVAEEGEIRIADLATRFDVSLMTMHRDLDVLAERHMLRKERGRAVAYPALTMETATRFREDANLAEKRAMCDAVASRIEAGSTVLMDDSSTLYPLAGSLARAGVERLSVITNSIGVAQHVTRELPRAEVTLLGGRFHGEFNSCTGPEVTRALGRLHADLALMSATTILQGHLYHPLREFVEVKEAMMESAADAMLLVDHTKFGKTATFMYGTAADYRTVFTDDAVPDDEITAMRDLHADIHIVSPGVAR